MSCLKQTQTLTLTLTLALGPVKPTGAITPEEADRAEEAKAVKAAAVTETITETAQLLDIHLMEKWNMVLLPNPQLLKAHSKLLNTRRLLMLYQYSAQTKDTDLLTMSFVRIPNLNKRLCYQHIQTQHDGHLSIMLNSKLSTQWHPRMPKALV